MLPSPSIPLREIRHVLLDMDGTLLDRYFDDYFWRHLLPEKYAEKHEMTFRAAKKVLLGKYRRHESTLNWTDIDFWSREVDLDIPALKEQMKHLIEVHPHVEEFLKVLRRRRKSIHLVTNAHYKVLDLKLKKTKIGKYFHSAVTSFEIGYPKERIEFWVKLQRFLDFDRERTLFIDDTEEILRTARVFGIRHLFLKVQANSRLRDMNKFSADFPVVRDYREFISLFD